MVKITSAGQNAAIAIAFTAKKEDGNTLYDYNSNAIRKNYASNCREFFAINADGSETIESCVGALAAEAVASNTFRTYRQVGTAGDHHFVSIDVAGMADIPVGTTIEIRGVRANA